MKSFKVSVFILIIMIVGCDNPETFTPPVENELPVIDLAVESCLANGASYTFYLTFDTSGFDDPGNTDDGAWEITGPYYDDYERNDEYNLFDYTFLNSRKISENYTVSNQNILLPMMFFTLEEGYDSAVDGSELVFDTGHVFYVRGRRKTIVDYDYFIAAKVRISTDHIEITE